MIWILSNLSFCEQAELLFCTNQQLSILSCSKPKVLSFIKRLYNIYIRSKPQLLSSIFWLFTFIYFLYFEHPIFCQQHPRYNDQHCPDIKQNMFVANTQQKNNIFCNLKKFKHKIYYLYFTLSPQIPLNRYLRSNTLNSIYSGKSNITAIHHIKDINYSAVFSG